MPACLSLFVIALAASEPSRAAPGGSPAPDGELLAALREGHVALTAARARAQRTLGELRAARYDDRLAALPPERAAREGAPALRRRLLRSWSRLQLAMSRRDVDPRLGCDRQELLLRGATQGELDRAARTRPGPAREEARECLGRLVALTRAVQAASGEVDAVLPAARAAAAP